MLWVDSKYINLLSSRLENFKRKSQNLWNFKCPICGDSSTNKSKSRGYIFIVKSDARFYCHNCNASHSFKNFLKLVDTALYNEYVVELYKENHPEQTNNANFVMQRPVFDKKVNHLASLKKLSQLNPRHPAKTFVTNRQIPTVWHSKLYYADKFNTWVNTIIPNKFPEREWDESRLVIPFFNDENVMVGFQGRSLKPDAKLRYITIMIDENSPRIFGLNNLDKFDTIYVVEGPIDSMFLTNCIASAGGEIYRELPKLNLDKDLFTIVFDNEPRNKHTVGKIAHAIELGYNVCIWPSSVIKKDINDMVLKEIHDTSFVNTELIQRIGTRLRKLIDANTFKGLEATMKLNEWKRV